MVLRGLADMPVSFLRTGCRIITKNIPWEGLYTLIWGFVSGHPDFYKGYRNLIHTDEIVSYCNGYQNLFPSRTAPMNHSSAIYRKSKNKSCRIPLLPGITVWKAWSWNTLLSDKMQKGRNNPVFFLCTVRMARISMIKEPISLQLKQWCTPRMPKSHQSGGKHHRAYWCFDFDGCYVLWSIHTSGNYHGQIKIRKLIFAVCWQVHWNIPCKVYTRCCIEIRIQTPRS